MPDAVDEETGRSVDAAVNAAHPVFLDSFDDLARLDGGAEFDEVKPELLRPDGQNSRLKISLVFINQVVHLPEFSLQRGGFRRLGGHERIGMRLRQGKVSEDEAQFFAERLLDLFDDRIGGAAVGALVITVFDQRQRSAGKPLGMVARGNRRGEGGGFVHGGFGFEIRSVSVG